MIKRVRNEFRPENLNLLKLLTDGSPPVGIHVRAYDLNDIARGYCSRHSALLRRHAIDRRPEEAGRIQVTRASRVDAVRASDAALRALIAHLDKAAASANLENDDISILANLIKSLVILLARESRSLLLVGEDHVDILADQPLHKLQVLLHNVI